jgi:hypothetical protein
MYLLMNDPASSNGVSIGNYLNASRGGKLNPCPPLADNKSMPKTGGFLNFIKLNRMLDTINNFRNQDKFDAFAGSSSLFSKILQT